MSLKLRKSLTIFFIFIFVLTSFNYPHNYVVASVALDNAQSDRAILEQQLADLEKEIAQKQVELNQQKGQSVSISRDITILTTQINKAKLDIKAKGLIIQKLGGEIVQKNQTIDTLNTKINKEYESLAQLIRNERQMDDVSVVSLVLSQNSISDVYGDIDTYASIKRSVQQSVDQIRGIKTLTETEKQALVNEQTQVTDTKMALIATQQKIQLNETQQKNLLAISKGKESDYQKILAEKAKQRAQILSALFSLRDVSAIPFSKALEYANQASKQTGIRPAFLLAILTQESNLGANQGSCYVTDMTTGAGVSSKSGAVFANVMKPTRDIAPFTEITAAVGRDPYKTLVSCPIGGFGYGGAMGPAQFIPSTWQWLKARVASALGISAADPWVARDAFMASALYLTDLGAAKGGYTAEHNAACKYYSGSSCGLVKGNTAYGDQVYAKAQNIQTTMIDLLQD